LKQVRLWYKIEARGGLDNIIGDDFFSPGESQVLVFTRVLLRDSKIPIMDEFTSR
jgi:ATP-binding cassette, subfamily C (CFTR/MRP), member 1